MPISRLFLFAITFLVISSCTSSTKPEPEEQPKQPFPQMVCYCAKSCLSLIQSKIHWYWNKPETTSQNRVKTIVMIDLNKEADIENATITQSSGDKRVDNKAVEAIYEAAPFREIHGLSLKEKEMIKRIEIAF